MCTGRRWKPPLRTATSLPLALQRLFQHRKSSRLIRRANALLPARGNVAGDCRWPKTARTFCRILKEQKPECNVSCRSKFGQRLLLCFNRMLLFSSKILHLSVDPHADSQVRANKAHNAMHGQCQTTRLSKCSCGAETRGEYLYVMTKFL